ncbi:MAG: PEP-CTERM sorting domain-containing protein [Gammaproteobacteria bacterium]
MNNRIATLIKSLLLLSALTAHSAFAVVIFQDDFNRGTRNNVGNGWAEIERSSNDVRIHNNVLNLRDRQSGMDAAATQSGFSTIGLTDIMLSYDWGASYNTESADTLHVEWRVTGSSSWTELVAHALGGSSLTNNVLMFGIAAANQASIDFRFYTSVSASNERALIDNVMLTGRAAAVAVSEPTTLMLMGLGMLGFLRRRARATA